MAIYDLIILQTSQARCDRRQRKKETICPDFSIQKHKTDFISPTHFFANPPTTEWLFGGLPQPFGDG